MQDDNQIDREKVFQFFNEIGIINQLANALLAKTLPDGVHPSHFGILSHMTKRGDGSTPAKIASAMQVTKATMTHSLNVLEKHGFIELKSNPDDARSKVVRLTSEGRAFHAKAAMGVVERFGHIISNDDATKMGDALPVLQQIRVLLDNNR